MGYEDLLKTIPTFSSLALLEDNFRDLKKKKKGNDLIKRGMKNIVATELIRLQARQ